MKPLKSIGNKSIGTKFIAGFRMKTSGNSTRIMFQNRGTGVAIDWFPIILNSGRAVPIASTIVFAIPWWTVYGKSTGWPPDLFIFLTIRETVE